MPERKRILQPMASLAEYVAGCWRLVDATRVLQRQWPRKPGPFALSITSTVGCAGPTAAVKMPDFLVLQPEIGQVAIARRDAGGSGEQAVDGGHKAAEDSAGSSEGGGGGLGHFGSLSEARRRRGAFREQSRYTRCQRQSALFA